MKANYGKIDSIVVFLLMAFYGITLSGCGDDSITVSELFADSDEYKTEKRIEVQGKIADIQVERKIHLPPVFFEGLLSLVLRAIGVRKSGQI